MSGAIAVVIPAYNEAETIEQVVGRAVRYADRVIVVDDGSTDDTAERVASMAVDLVRHPDNRGKAESLRTGMERALEAGAAAVITLDGDGQHDPDDIPRLLDAAVQAPGHVIVAARREDRSAAPPLRRFANGFADFWISWAAGQWIEDTQSGFRLFPAEAVRRILPRCARYRRFVFETMALIEAARNGHRIEAVPVRTVYPPGARPSYYGATLDTWLIVRAVAWHLIKRGMAPLDLCRALGWLPAGHGARRDDRAGRETEPDASATGTDTSAPPPRTSRWKA